MTDKVDSIVAYILWLLDRKVAEVIVSVRSQIDALSIAQLEALGEALLDFTQPAELTAWLAENQAS